MQFGNRGRFILWMAKKNIERWRWRLVCMAALLALGFILHIFYSAATEVNANAAIHRIEQISTPYYDALVVLEDGSAQIDPDSWPEYIVTGRGRLVQREIIEAYEEAIALSLISPRGSFDVLGLKQDTHFFDIPEAVLQGRMPSQGGELLLPESIALQQKWSIGDTIPITVLGEHVYQTQMLYRSFTLVGTYADANEIAVGRIGYEDALALQGSGEANRLLFAYRRASEADLSSLLTLLRVQYPSEVIYSQELPQEMGASLMQQFNRSSTGILAFIFLFSCIGVLTVVLLTFFERQKEMAALKAMGMNSRQIGAFIVLEQLAAELMGLFFCFVLLTACFVGLPWLRQLPLPRLVALVLRAGLGTLLIFFLTLLFPLMTLRVASVDQLLHGRRVPFMTKSTDHLDTADAFLIERERSAQVRILKTPPQSNATIYYLRHEGEHVKKGEIIARYESFFGYVVQEWCAFCDGLLTEINEGGLIIIRPDDPQTPFFDYDQMRIQAAPPSKETYRYGRISTMQTREAGAPRPAAAMPPPSSPAGRSAAVPARAEPPARRNERIATLIRAWRWPLVGLAVLALAYAQLQSMVLYRSEQASMLRYTSHKVESMTLRHEIVSDGWLSVHGDQELTTAAAGRIEAVFVQQGDAVVQGQPLIEMSNPGLQSQLRAAEQTLAEAQRAYDTLLLASHKPSEAELQVLALTQRLEELCREQDNLRIVAPEDGIIAAVETDIGDELESGQIAFSLRDHALSEEDAYRLQLLQAQAEMQSSSLAQDKLGIRAAHPGRVESVDVSVGESVEPGRRLLRLQLGDVEDEAWRLAADRARLDAEAAQRHLDSLTLRAPGKGSISGLRIQKGERVAAGQAVAVWSDSERWVVTVDVAQHLIQAVQPGNAAELAAANGRKYEGIVAEVAREGQSDPETRVVTFAVQIALAHSGLDSAGLPVTARIESSDPTVAGLGGLRGTLEPMLRQTLYAPADAEVAELFVEDGAVLEADQAIVRFRSLEGEMAQLQTQSQLRDVQGETVRSDIQAEVAEIHVRPGEEVAQGQLLLSLRSAVLSELYADASLHLEELRHDRIGNRSILSRGRGVVRHVYVQPGDEVKKGQILAELDHPELRYQLRSAENELRKAEAIREAERLNPLSGATAQALLRLETARTEWQSLRTAVDGLLLQAPRDGTIIRMQNVRVGESLKAGAHILSLGNAERFILQTHVDELQIRHLTPGTFVAVQVWAFPNDSFQGQITEIGREGVMTELGSAFPVTVELAGDGRLRPGMSASFSQLLEQAEFVLAIPTDYLQYESIDGVRFSYVELLSEGRARRVEVSTGLQTQEMTEIKQGLREGDTVLKLTE